MYHKIMAGLPLLAGLLLVWTAGWAAPGDGWHSAEVGGLTLEYGRAGAGPALVVLPAGPGMDVRLYARILSDLQDDMTVFYVNPRGSGGSGTPEDGDYSMKAMASDLDRLREHWDLESLSILGHGHGAMVGLQYALEYGEHLDRLVLSGGAHYLGEEWCGQREKALQRHPAYEEYMELPGYEQNSAEATLLLDFYDYDPEKFDWLVPYLDVSLEANSYFMEKEWDQWDVRDQIAELDRPGLLVWGAHDVVDPIERAEELAELLPEGQLHVLENAAHLAFAEKTEAFVDALHTFLLQD